MEDVDTEVLLGHAPSIGDSDTSSSVQELPSFSGPAAEVVDLVNNLNEVVAILNELRFSFSPRFGHSFGTYIHYVYSSHNDEACTADHEIIGEVADIVHEIIEFQDGNNTSVHQVIDRLRAIHGQLCTMQGPKATLLVRLVCFQHHVASVAETKCFRRWSLAYSQTRVTLSLPKRRFFRRWRARAREYAEVSVQAQIYSQKRTSAHVFSLWIQRVLQSLQRDLVADSVFSGKFFRRWVARFGHFNVRSIEFRHQSLKKSAFSCLQAKLRHNSSHKSLALQLLSKNDMVLAHTVFEQWKHRYLEVQNSAEYSVRQELNLRLSRWLKRRFFDTIQRRSQYSRSLREFQQRSSIRKMQLMFSKMAQKNKLAQQSRNFQRHLQHSLKAHVFRGWTQKVVFERHISQFQRRHLLHKIIHTWKLRVQSKGFQTAQDRKVKTRFLQKWRLERCHSLYLSNLRLREVSKNTETWRRKFEQLELLREQAVKCHEDWLKKRVLIKVRSKAGFFEDLENVADLNFQRVHFENWKSALARVQKLEGCQVQNFSSLQKKNIFQKWRSTYLQRYEAAANDVIFEFQQNYQRTRRVWTFFQIWRRSTHNQQQKNRHLQQNLAFFNDTNILKSEVFLLWMEKSAHLTHLKRRSEDFYELVLRKRFASLWYQRYNNKSLYLQSIANDMINNRDYMTTRNFLHKWSFKHTKNVRRNQQSCLLFQEKWHRAHLRSFWELWRFKYGQEYDSMLNESFQSFSISPLHNKNPSSRHDSNLLSHSYLQTPIKNQEPQTPSHQNPSPTKLSETNQRMRSSKIEALVTRYKSASSIEQRQKPSNKDPPTLARFSTPQLPPPPPRFKTRNEMPKEHESDPTPNATSSPYQEDDVVTNAKMLQKIKPIQVPFEHELKYSSPRRLRERFLKSPTRSPKSSVFE